MSHRPRVSIVIDSYNYGRFLAQAVDSALNQDYPDVEVIVVDDGSTDHSPEVIAGYGDRIVAVLQENRGQGAAFNTGFRHSRGDIVIFLDSDDALFPTAAAAAVEALGDPQIIKAHWPMHVIDEVGQRTGKMCPKIPLRDGFLRPEILRGGPWAVSTPPTSCNAWRRSFLESVLPMPESDYRLCADSYLVTLGWLLGATRLVTEPQGLYRVHGRNNYAGRPLFQKLRRDMEVYDMLCRLMADYCARHNIAVDAQSWSGESWWMRDSWPHKVYRATQELSALIPPGQTYILVDDENWGGQACENRRQLPFLEKNGQYWGPPANDAIAISEFERLRKEYGAAFIAFAWPSFWWLDYYQGFARHLRERFDCLLKNDRLIVYAINSQK